MARFFVRVHDGRIRTNYIERVVEADDKADALAALAESPDIADDIKDHFTTTQDLETCIRRGDVEISPIPHIETVHAPSGHE